MMPPSGWTADFRWEISTTAHSGNYAARHPPFGGPSFLTSPAIDLADYTGCSLELWHREEDGRLILQVSVVGGTWSTLGVWEEDNPSYTRETFDLSYWRVI